MKSVIKSSEIPNKDIFFQGNLVESDATVIIVEKDRGGNYFSGTIIKAKSNIAYPEGYHYDKFAKSSFNQFKGVIELSA